jgi:dienelactone hydrolase
MQVNWRAAASAIAGAWLTACVTTDAQRIPQLESQPFGKQPTLLGYLVRPDGPGPHPAVVLMHGCSGLELATARQDAWNVLQDHARRYAAKGYVALILDSYAPRGQGNLCGKSDWAAPYQVRAWDAAAAARHLVALGDVAKDKIVVEGLSAGASSAMYAVSADGPPAGTFAAAIAWYPNCSGHALRRATAPVLLLAGGKDTWTPAALCAYVRDQVLAEQPDAAFEMRVYPDATHAFDYPYRTPVYFEKHMLVHDSEATADSWARIDSFLAKHVD